MQATEQTKRKNRSSAYSCVAYVTRVGCN